MSSTNNYKILKYNPRSIKDELRQANAGYQILKDYLFNLESNFNQIEPNIHAFIPEQNRFKRLQKQIETWNQNLVRQRKKPLQGLMVAVKDIFQVDGMATRAGSQLPPELLSGPQAECVSSLMKLGALILGKTVTTEFAYFSPGPTRNPHHLAHTPGGSSSGSAAAVAAGLASFAFGTQTIGSIIRPASYCGVIGFKPTYARISTEGVIPLAPSVDTVGYFTADLASASFIAPFLLTHWNPLPTPLPQPVLGIPTGPYLGMVQTEMEIHFWETCLKLQGGGFHVIEIPIMADFESLSLYHNQIVAYEAAETHKQWFRHYKDLYHPKTTELILRGQTISIEDYQRSLESREELRAILSDRMETDGIDLWLSPSAQGTAPIGLESTGNPIMNLPWTHCGFPTLNLPSGTDKVGLPFGLQVTAKWGQDESLLNWAHSLSTGIH